jgi:uncharacterized protein involved in outer membrane biogenesis
MKKLLLGLLALILIIVGVVAYGIMNSGSLIKEAVNKYAPDMTLTKVELAQSDISFMSGAASMKGLVIGNPKGFSDLHSMKVDNVTIRMNMQKTTEKLIHLEEITIEGVDLNLEIGKAGNNFKVIQKNIETFLKNKGVDMESDSQSDVKFIVDQINLRGTKVRAKSEMLGKAIQTTLPDLSLSNIGTGTGGATGAEIAEQIFGKLNKSLTKNVTETLLKGKANDLLKDVEKKATDKIKGLFK